MVRCPACGWRMRKGDLPGGSFVCPGCNTKLRWPKGFGLQLLTSHLLTAILAFLGPYLMGVQGRKLLLYAFLLYAPIVSAISLLRALLFPRRLERDSTPEGEGIQSLGGGPEPPNR